MKKILCFGDSNTYGFNPADFSRYDNKSRWSGILNNKFDVIEAGCNNRSCFNNIGELNSLETLPKYLNNELDYIILQIGINDLQFQYDISLEIFKENLEKLIKLIDSRIKVILLCPNIIDNCILKSYFANLFDESSVKKSKQLPEIYNEVALKNNCILINLNNIAKTSNIDSLHYDIKNHQLIAKEIINQVCRN